MVYLHSPIVFQSLIVLSRAPDTICIEDMTIQQGLAQLLHLPAAGC